MQDASDMKADGYVIILAAGEINNLPLQILTLCLHGNFICFLSSAEFFKINIRDTIRVSNSLGPDQA